MAKAKQRNRTNEKNTSEKKGKKKRATMTTVPDGARCLSDHDGGVREWRKEREEEKEEGSDGENM